MRLYPAFVRVRRIICLVVGSWMLFNQAALAAESSERAKLAVRKSSGGVEVTEGDRPVLFYQCKPKAREGNLARCGYVHPLYGLSGEVLTEDFPDDHLHHRGVFWAWHQMRVADKPAGDSWALEGFVSRVRDVKTVSAAGTIALVADVEWISTTNGGQSLLLEENTKITVHGCQQERRVIDFQIQLVARVKDLWLGGSETEPGYGGYSLRLRLPEDVRFTNHTGIVKPQLAKPVEGPWIDVSASFNGNQREGITALSHRSSRGYPHPWVLRSSKSMQNAAWPGRNAVRIATEEPTILRYRLILHRDAITADVGNHWQREYDRIEMENRPREWGGTHSAPGQSNRTSPADGDEVSAAR